MSEIYGHGQFIRKVETSADWLKDKTGASPAQLIVLTGGLDGPEEKLTEKKIINSRDIPNFPVAQAKGHTGQLIFGRLEGIEVVLLKGRFHYYEGFDAREILFPYFVLEKMGIKSVITVNAVGGIRHDLEVGNILLVTDHINFMGSNPLRGISVHSENQFPDLSEPYDLEYQKLAQEEADRLGIEIKEGVLLSTTGPSYETKAEIRMFRHFGADVVGMSSVFETIACNYLGIKVLTFSFVSNLSTDRRNESHNHEEVLQAVERISPMLGKLVINCAKEICHKEHTSLEAAVL
jgi:purine-nucleoside phosphorylase